MKRFLFPAILLSVFFLAGRFWSELSIPATGQGSGGACAGNGDVNGDGDYDVSDAVYFLTWRFIGGPAPVPILPPKGGPLPATGQVKCYDLVQNEWPCTVADFPGQDAFYRASCPTESRFVDNGDGTVTDTCTGLMWQKNTADINEDGTIELVDHRNWQDALKYCENLDFAGHTDWRLPNVRELQSIVDYGRASPAIDPAFGAESDWYWSSTSPVNLPYGAWSVNFIDGIVSNVNYGGKGAGYFVRAVRGGL